MVSEELYVDVLREASSVGASHAAGAISTMVNRRVRIEAPNTSLKAIDRVSDILGEARVVTEVVTDARRNADKTPSYLFLLLSERETLRLLSLVLDKSVETVTEFERSVLLEIGNIVTCSFVGALANLVGSTIKPGVPHIRMNKLLSLLAETLAQCASFTDRVWLSSIRFFIEGGEAHGYILFVPSFDIVAEILRAKER